LIKTIDCVVETSKTIARCAGALLGSEIGTIVDALIAATADTVRATDILTTVLGDLTILAGSETNVHRI
jgi:hypothetical protein